MKTSRARTTIRQTVTLPAAPGAVYSALIATRQHARLTGAPARISSKVGGSIMAYGGYITGTNLELQPGKKIVQAWHMQDWPAGHLSRCTFRLERIRGGTRLHFTHSGVPHGHLAAVKQGWIDHYWTPLKAMLAAK